MPENPASHSRTLPHGISPRLKARAMAGTLLSRALARPGRLLEPAYLAAAETLVNREMTRIRQTDIGRAGYFGLMSLYPELQRTFFIHIPKCGGTSIRQSLVDEYCCAPVPLPGDGATRQAIDYMVQSVSPDIPARQLLDACAGGHEQDLARRFLATFTGYRLARSPGRIFILGHKFAREMALFHRRDRDFFFATVRDPVEALKSMVAYRVAHTLANRNRLDSIEFLASLQLEYPRFEDLVANDPEELTRLALNTKHPSLATFLAMDERTDCESVWSGLGERTVFIAHMSEQSAMLERLFGARPKKRHKNSSSQRQGPAADFSAALQDAWIEPHVDPESRLLYQRMENAGVIGFWQNGGTKGEYSELIKAS